MTKEKIIDVPKGKKSDGKVVTRTESGEENKLVEPVTEKDKDPTWESLDSSDQGNWESAR